MMERPAVAPEKNVAGESRGKTLKSTYRPSAAAVAPLPPGWTEHRAPTGHTYYFNAETKQSTYRRPGPPVPQLVPQPPASYGPYPSVPNLSDPQVANAYLAQLKPQPQLQPQHERGERGGFQARPRPQPVDRPRRKEAIPGCEPWMLVYTKYSRRFVYHPVKNVSYWRIPEKLMPGILELDKARIRAKAGGSGDDKGEQRGDRTAEERGDRTTEERGDRTTEERGDRTTEERGDRTAEERGGMSGKDRDDAKELGHTDGDSSEYEEVEVTDDEAQGELGAEHRSKRQRTEDNGGDGPVEFTEADMAAQLQMMGDEYGLEPGDYDDGDMSNWPEGAEGVDLTEEDAKCLFKDLLNDLHVNPYSPWDKLLEEGRIVDDARYTALSTTRARKDCWDEWSRARIAELKEQRARQEQKDPRVAYMAFLQEKATPKLYWPEFKRKYKKEEAMKDLRLSDRDREKAYRELMARLKMPQATLKSNLTALLRAQPLHLLHGQSLSRGLPAQVVADVRYISLAPELRDPLVEAYVQTLPPPPGDGQAADEDGEREREREREARGRREKALWERNRAVEEQRRRRERDVAASKARLREGEREIAKAMRVDKRGLQSQLAEGET